MSGNSENSFGSYRPMWPTKPLQPLIRPSVQPLRPTVQPAVNRPLQPLQTLKHPRIPPPPYPAPPNQLINQRAPLRTVQSGPDLNKQLSDCLEQMNNPPPYTAGSANQLINQRAPPRTVQSGPDLNKQSSSEQINNPPPYPAGSANQLINHQRAPIKTVQSGPDLNKSSDCLEQINNPPPYPAGSANQLINHPRAPLKSVQSGSDFNKQLTDCLEQINNPPTYPVSSGNHSRAALKTVQQSGVGPDLNKQLSDCLEQIKELKDKQKQMKHDNQELRDLCCFLDDDRQRARKLAKEWQKFGRYTAKVMRQEVSNYQQKLKQLDGRQQELVRDNYELKDLCLYLDEERNCIDLKCPHCGEKILSRPGSVVPPDDDEAVTQRLMDHKSSPDSPLVSEASNSSSNSSGVMSMSSQEDHIIDGPSCTNNAQHNKSKQVLNIYHTAIENEDTSETQKAIIQEMCNVVWKALDVKKSE